MTTLIQARPQIYESTSDSSNQVDKVVQSVTNATKRLSQISTNTSTSSKKRKAQNRIGPWKLGRTLGRGSTGRVRLAKNINTGQLAAVKIVPKSNFKKLENPKYKRSTLTENGKDRLPYGIEREIIIMKLISHPNIMGLYDVWENKNDLYLILEYIEGGELFDYLIKRGKLHEFEAVNYFKQIIHGISYLHQFNICHRDLKPENLLLDLDKNIKIADFGMAALEVNEKLLETSCGSPHYASPEIVAGKNYHGAPSDIWSCGIILFALLTGHLPFDDENIRTLLLKVQNGKYVMPPDLSWEAKDLISKMLRVNPNDRITIDKILTHPLLTRYPEPSTIQKMEKSLDFKKVNIKPMSSVDKIDKEILKNLAVLFHNCSEQSIVSKLLSQRNCAEKTFYYLLMKYRNEHTGTGTYYEDDTDLTGSESKQTLPRSTSIVKTITVDPTTGEKHTTIKTIAKSGSIYSNKSSRARTPPVKKERKTVLGNITNTTGISASTSVTRKKEAMKMSVRSRNNSSKSLSSSKSKRKHLHHQLHNQYPLPHQPPPVLRRKPNGLLEMDTDSSDSSPARSGKKIIVGPRRQAPETPARISRNFEQICHDVFGVDEVESLATPISKTYSSKSPRVNSDSHTVKQVNEDSSSPHEMEKSIRDEKTARAHRSSHASQIAKEAEAHAEAVAQRERAEQDFEEARAKKELEEERKRQSQLLKEKQRQASLRLSQHDSQFDFAQSSRRHVTEPISSLDPKNCDSSLQRSKSLARASSQSDRGMNQNTALVLQSLGIDVTSKLNLKDSLHAPKRINSGLKTSSSKNLSMYLQSQDVAEKENLTIDKYNEKEKPIVKPGIPSANSPVTTISNMAKPRKMAYKSLLGEINEDKVQKNLETRKSVHADTSFANDTTAASITTRQSGLIPNPRFSRFSFNGLLNSNFESGNVDVTGAKRFSTRQNNPNVTLGKGDGLLKKSSTTNLGGLGINVKSNKGTTQSSTKINTTADAPSDTDDFINLSGDSSFDINDIQYSKDSLWSDEKDEYHTTILDSEFSNFEVLSTHTADIVTVHRSKPNLVDGASSGDSSRETLVVHPHPSSSYSQTMNSSGGRTIDVSEQTQESIKSIYKDYQSLVRDDRRPVSQAKTYNVLEENKPNLRPDSEYQSHFKIMHNENREGEHTSDEFEDTSGDESERRIKFTARVNSNIDILDNSSFADSKEFKNNTFDFETSKDESERPLDSQFSEDEKEVYEEQSKSSRSSTQIFSTMALHKTAAGADDDEVLVADEYETGPQRVGSLFRRISLKPKRAAPKAPEEDNTRKVAPGHKFHGIAPNAKKTSVELYAEELPSRKGNWFKRLMNGITTSTTKVKDSKRLSMHKSQDIYVQDRDGDKNVHVIDSVLIATDLTRVIKNTLQLKYLEGSVSQCVFDDEFGIITGSIPAKFANGRRLKFKMEIIDLINSSSLHIFREKGSEKGFKTFTNVVEFIIHQEEQAQTRRRPHTDYSFSGYKGTS
ncbi:serine/threonine-protein kinase Hsl1p [[Candida] anglica]|uniref:non-specific serine/threonine protein kinase n=1 Tax=[Candida] anglica TaxID=148631 RepID=A0ABP0E8A9_9ASCO